MSSSVNGCPGTVFLVTIDVEADNEWARPSRPTYDSIQVLPAFQRLCDRYGIKPTYLVTYDVAADSNSSSVLLELLEEGNCEIGAHMHGWRTPPFYPPLDSDSSCHPYLYDYPPHVQTQKLGVLTEHLAATFGVAITSHRAGRWGIDARGLSLLQANNYLVDSSVAPLRSWADHKGDPGGKRGPSFLQAPTRLYRPAIDDVERRGERDILEIPVSVRVLGLLTGFHGQRELASLLSGNGFVRRNA